MKKYFIGEVINVHGEIEIASTVRFTTVDENPVDYLEEITSNFWGEGVSNGDWYDFDNFVSTRSGEFKEISKEVFDALDSIVIL